MNVRDLIRSVITDKFPNPKILKGEALKELRALYREVEDVPMYSLSFEEIQDPNLLLQKLLNSSSLYNKTERCLAKISPPITGNPLHFVQFKFPLYDYQEEAILFMREREGSLIHGINGGILNMAMGLGKTYTALTRIMETRHESPIPTLVIVGASLIPTWTKDAMDKFFPSLKYLVYHPEYNKIQDFTQDELSDYDVILTTYDFIVNAYGKSITYENGIVQTIWRRNSEEGPAFPENVIKRQIASIEEDDFGFDKISPSYQAEFGFPKKKRKGKIIKNKALVRKYGKKEYDKKFNLPIRPKDVLSISGEFLPFFVLWPRIICDESQRFRSHTSTTYAALMSIPSICSWCMTGTPMVNTSNDLFTQMRFLGYDGATKFSDWEEWNCFERDKLIRAIFVKDASFLNLPPKEEVYDPCFFSQEENEYYVAYLAEFLRAIKSFKSSKLKSAQGEVLAMLTRLRQLCVCPYMVIEEKKDKKGKLIINPTLEKTYSGSLGFKCAKFRKIKEILLTIPAGEKVLIFSFFKEFMPLFQLFLEQENLGKSVMINGYKDPQERARDTELFKKSSTTNIALISYSTGSEGLNLMCANHVILTEPYWNDAKMRQAIARSYRKGQTRRVIVHRLYIERSVDVVLINLCRRKNKEIISTIEDASIEDGEIAEDEHGERISIGKIEEIARGLAKIEVLKRVKVNPSLPTSSSEEEESRKQIKYNEEQISQQLASMFGKTPSPKASPSSRASPASSKRGSSESSDDEDEEE